MKRKITSMLLAMLLSWGTAMSVTAGNETPFVPWDPDTTPSGPSSVDTPVIPTEPEDTEIPILPILPGYSDTPSGPSDGETPAFPMLPEVPEETEPTILPGSDTPTQPGSAGNTDAKTDPLFSVKSCKRDELCPMYLFQDLDRNAWYHDDIHFCIETGLMNGMSEYDFAPNGTLTRAMLVTVLWRLEGEPLAEDLVLFSDVPLDEWYSKAVFWAASEGIVNGYGDGTFGPANNVTREQIMAILHRYALQKKLHDGLVLPPLTTYEYSQWAKLDVFWADTVGMLKNFAIDITNTTVDASRAEIAAYLKRFCLLFLEEEIVLRLGK